MVCNFGQLENEYHILLFCDGFKKTRTKYLQEIVDHTEVVAVGKEAEIFKALLSSKAVKITAKYIELMFQQCKDILYEQARKKLDKGEDSEADSEEECDSDTT